MSTPIVSFRLKPEIYLELGVIVAEAGQTPSVYLKKKLALDTYKFLEDLQFMKGDISEILHLLWSNDEDTEVVESTSNQNDMVKVLILREVAAFNKVGNIQKLVNKSGMKSYNSLD